MKSLMKILLITVFVGLQFTGCELIDITDVENPQITEDKLFEDATGGATPLITGLEFAFSDAVSRTAVYTECVSDNFANTDVFLSTVFDSPTQITTTEMYLNDDREIYFKLQRLNALAEFGLITILPSDADANDEDYATVRFYKGMALLMLAENFVAFPVVELGPIVMPENALSIAIDQLQQSLDLTESLDRQIDCKLALARAYRLLGNAANAQTNAHEALILSADYVHNGIYDIVNLINRMALFVVDRNQQDMQPLPRLDFLDPKFTSLVANIPVLKMEEAHLILAEVSLSSGDVNGAKLHMIDAIGLANSRATEEFTDVDDRKGRPTGSDVKVKFSSDAEPIEGLVLNRNGETVTTYPVSHTQITEDAVNAVSDQTALFRMLYMLRQEIFFGEGRRMSDLGIRLPVMQRQIDANPNVSEGGVGTQVYVPSYIPGDNGLDQFTYDELNKVVTITNDMNEILSQHMPDVSPLF